MNERDPIANRAERVRLLSMTHGMPLDTRLGMLSGYFVGHPYLDEPLVGGRGVTERLVSRLDGFDCVTYAEAVWALAAARQPDDLEPALAALRYRRGRVDWGERNHYMGQWLARNEAAGRVRRVLPSRWRSLGEPRVLSVVRDLPAVEWEPFGLPAGEAPALADEARTGDLVCFLSTRPDLDVFHVGLLVAGEPLRLRHAGRSAGRVVDEPLGAFLERNETPGLLVARSTADDESTGGER